MEKLVILLILILVVGGISLAVVSDRKRKPAKSLSETMDCVPAAEIEPKLHQPSTCSKVENHSCGLAVTLRLVGIINVFASLILGPVLANDFAWVVAVAVILSGFLGCLFCCALAKCVDAADRYLTAIKR